MRYDPGSPADNLLFGPVGQSIFGNRFNSRSGQPLDSGTVTRISWYQGALGAIGTVALAVAGDNGAPLSVSIVIFSVAPTAFNSVAVSLPVDSSFFVGLIRYTTNNNGPPGRYGSLGVRFATTNSQGYHAIQRNLSAGFSVGLPMQNAMLRVAGNVVIPVELLEFDVD